MVQLEWTPIPSTCTFYKMTTTQQHCFCRTLSVFLPPTAAVSAALVIRSFRVFSSQVVLIRWRWQCLPCHSNSPRLQVQLSTFASSTLHVCKFNSPRLQVVLINSLNWIPVALNWFPEAARSRSIGFQKQSLSFHLDSRSSSCHSTSFRSTGSQSLSFGFQKQLVPFNFVLLSVACVWQTKPFYYNSTVEVREYQRRSQDAQHDFGCFSSLLFVEGVRFKLVLTWFLPFCWGDTVYATSVQ
jgi:hypothetical protein